MQLFDSYLDSATFRFPTVPSVLLHNEAKGQVSLPQNQEDSIQEVQAASARANSQEY